MKYLELCLQVEFNMSNSALAKFQIGKNGITKGVIESLTLALKNHKQIRISVLKSCCRNKEELEELATELKSEIPFNLKVRTIGYTIILIKLRGKPTSK